MPMAEYISAELARLLIAEKGAKELTKDAANKAEQLAKEAEIARLLTLEEEKKEKRITEAIAAIRLQHEKTMSEQFSFWFSDKNLDKKKGAYEVYRDNFKKVPIYLILHWPNLKKLCENIEICHVEYIASSITKHSQDLRIVLNDVGYTCIERIIPYETMPPTCKCLKCSQPALDGNGSD